jgi:hypothetical protein
MKLILKCQKPSVEKAINVVGLPGLILGIKAYTVSESTDIKEQLAVLSSSKETEQVAAKIRLLESEGDKTQDDFYVERDGLVAQLKAATIQSEKSLERLYKEQILYIKNITFESTSTGTINISDTRDEIVSPLAGGEIWNNKADRLDALLDVLLDYAPAREAIAKVVSEVVYNLSDTKVAKAKN